MVVLSHCSSMTLGKFGGEDGLERIKRDPHSTYIAIVDYKTTWVYVAILVPQDLLSKCLAKHHQFSASI